MKKVSVEEAWLSKYPELTILVVSSDGNRRDNLIALGWMMQTSIDPQMVAISVNTMSLSHQLIEESGDFVLVIPSEEMEEAVMFCGTHSGRDVDKFKATGLSAVKSRHVKPSLVDEAVVNMECKVVGKLKTGDHTIFVGEILSAFVSEESRKVLFNLGPHDQGRWKIEGWHDHKPWKFKGF